MNTPVVIFIRSYRGDLIWLRYALRSIEKFLTGHTRVVIVVPEPDAALFRKEGIEVQTVVETCQGYNHQQLTKIHADRFCHDGDPWIIYVDSDCLFTAPTDMSHFFRDGKPISLHTPYAMLPKPPEMPWKALTERALGFVCHDEIMRRQGAIYRASELVEFRSWFLANRGLTIDRYIDTLRHHDFSEFNVIGSWLWRFHHSTRCWLRTDVDPIPALPIRQFWSYGGVDANLAEINAILK